MWGLESASRRRAGLLVLVRGFVLLQLHMEWKGYVGGVPSRLFFGVAGFVDVHGLGHIGLA